LPRRRVKDSSMESSTGGLIFIPHVEDANDVDSNGGQRQYQELEHAVRLLVRFHHL
jgi:hypothetical protein